MSQPLLLPQTVLQLQSPAAATEGLPKPNSSRSCQDLGVLPQGQTKTQGCRFGMSRGWGVKPSSCGDTEAQVWKRCCQRGWQCHLKG